MSSRKIVKSHSENYSNQVKVNGVGYKRNLMKQEEIDLSSENNLDKESTPKTVHSISICINTFDEISNEDIMRQELNDVDQVSEISNLGNGVKQIKIKDDLKQSFDSSILPINDHCDFKDKKRTKHLVRCEAVRESSLSPPPQNLDPNQVNSNKLSFNNTNHLPVYSNNKNVTIIKNSSLKSSSQSNSATTSPSLSRDSSTENNLEYTTAELQTFLVDTLKRNQKDRMFLLRVEQELIQLIKDGSKELHKFTPTSSYNRLLIHRVAAYFGLEHNVDHTHTSVIVTKSKNTRLPDIKLKDLTKDDESSDEPKKSILKRDSNSLEDSSNSSFDKDKSPESHLNGSLSDSSRSRSLEEREENYERVRARIFNNSTEKHLNDMKMHSIETTSSVAINGTEQIELKTEEAIVPKTQSSLENESHNDCDNKPKDALLPNKPLPAPNNNQAKNNNHEAKKSTNSHNRFEGNNRAKLNNHRNSKSAYSDQNYNRFHNRKIDLMTNKANENDWSLKPNLTSKLTSQNTPYNFLYANCPVEGSFVPRYPPALNPHAHNSNQFPLGQHAYMQSPLLPNEQLFPQLNYVNPSMLPLMSNQANVPNSMLNQISYNNNAVNSSFSSSSFPFPNNYQHLIYAANMQSLCGSNGVPYSPPSNLPAAPPPNLNSLLGMPYQHYPTLSINNLMQNIPPNFKNAPMNDFDKSHLKNVSFTKSPIPPMNYPMVPGQFSCPEVLDRNLASVQFNSAHLPSPADLMINRTAVHPSQFTLGYPNSNKRLPNEMILNNPALAQQAQSSMYLNQQKSFYANQPKPNSVNKYPNSSNSNRSRRGANNSNRKY